MTTTDPAVEPARKRIGRPPGSKTKKKAAAPDDTPSPRKRRKRRGGRRPAKKRAAKRAAKRVVAPVREFACFLDEDNDLQLCRADGEGEPLTLTAADALAVAAFVERHRATFEG